MAGVGMNRPDDRATSRARRRLPPLLAALAVLLVALWGFAALAEGVISGDPIVDVDRAVANWLHARATPALTVFFVVITTFGSAWVLIPLAVGAVVLLMRRGRRADALLVFLAVGGAQLLTMALKAGFARERPFFPDPLATESTFSFPSGHSTNSLACYGVLAIVVARSRPDGAWRLRVAVPAAVLVLLIGFSRLYLGVHFLSDVLAGFAAGLTWLVLCTLAVFARRRTSRVG